VNPETNHLTRVLSEDALRALQTDGYEPLPVFLQHAAEKKLGGSEASVSRTSGGKLSKWAAKRRKSRRAMEKATRRHQRR